MVTKLKKKSPPPAADTPHTGSVKDSAQQIWQAGLGAFAKAQAEGTIRKDIDWHVATKRGLIKAMPDGIYKELTVLVERKKAQIRARVEHPFHVIKNLFGYKKVSYRELRKNGARLYAQYALANLCWPSAACWMTQTKALVRTDRADELAER